jgi:hypothetical protein
VTGSACVCPVFVLVARTLSPGLSWLIGIAAPVASRTLVPAVKLSPPHVAASARSLLVSSAASHQSP